MRIAYVSLHWPRASSSGVGKKMEQQMRAWRSEGHDVRLFMHMHPPENTEPLVQAERYQYRLSGNKLRTEIERSRAMSRLLNGVRAYQPDIIYLRSAIYTYPAHRLAQIAPVVMEFNTNELSQHQYLGGIYRLYSQLTRGLLIGRSSGYISISNEIATAPELARTGRPSVVIGNSYDVEETPALPAPGNERPRLAFVGSPGNVWHGVEKLATLAERYPDLVVERKIVQSPPVAALLQAAENADTIVVGSRGRGGIQRLLLGSVSHGVLQALTRTTIVTRA